MDHQHHPLKALAALASVVALLAPASQAHSQSVTDAQRATAQQVAERGVPLAELAAGAPDTYVVQRGDTLWSIAALYLNRPWRWPELWGMNLQSVANPHLIYPGQTLYLERAGGHARLRTSRAGAAPGNETVRVSPHTRSESLSSLAVPTLKAHLIEPFLAEPLVVDERELALAPRIIAAQEERFVLGSGDRVYARGPQSSPLELETGSPRKWRIFRNATPLKDPVTGQVLGYEAHFVGQATLVRGESVEQAVNAKGEAFSEIVPATVQLSRTVEEVRIGDRLLPAPERTFSNYAPHAPREDVEAAVVSLYGGTAMRYAGQNAVIAINRGSDDGLQAGHVLRLITRGRTLVDKTDEDRASVRLPHETNGLAMVFRTFERVSYALVLQAQQPVVVGDRLTNPD